MRLILCAALFAAACGPKPAPRSGSGGENGGTGAATGSGTSTSDGGPATPPRPPPLSRAECEQMIDHVLDVGMAQQRASKPADYVPTPEQVAKIRERLVIDQLSACLAWSRTQWQCVMTATTVETLYGCAETAPTSPPP
jgi:hypothetical protein